MSTDTDAKLIARVDAWVAAQCESWTGDRRIVAEEWRHKSRTTRTDGPDAGDRAAMGGILLALVRLAWGDAVEIEVTSLANGEGFIVIREDDVDVWEGFGFDSLAAALVAALEAAP